MRNWLNSLDIGVYVASLFAANHVGVLPYSTVFPAVAERKAVHIYAQSISLRLIEQTLRPTTQTMIYRV